MQGGEQKSGGDRRAHPPGPDHPGEAEPAPDSGSLESASPTEEKSQETEEGQGPVDRPIGSDSRRVSQSVLRLTSGGLELAGYTLIIGGIGYWIDLQFQYEPPYLGIAGVLVGFSLGMFRLIRLAKEVGDQ